MAFIRENNDEETPVVASNTASPMVGSTTSGRVAPKKGSGGFTNINSYIEANKPQTNQLGQGIANKIQDKSTQVKNTLQATKSKFQDTTNPEIQRVNQGETFVQDAFEKANTGQKLDEQGLNKFVQYRENQGPQFQVDQSLNQIQSDAQQAKGFADMSQSSQGRTQLLSNFYGQPNYSAGQKRLDQLLLQTTPGLTRSITQQTQAATKGLPESVTTERTAQESTLADITAKRNALQQMINEQTNAHMGTLQSELDKNLEEKQAERSTTFENTKKTIQEQIAAGKFQEAQQAIKDLTGQELDLSGLHGRDYFTRGLDSYWKNQFLSGMNPDINDYTNMINQAVTPYLSEGERLNLETATTDDLRARYQALADLAGTMENQRLLADEATQATPIGLLSADTSKEALANAAAIRDKINKQLQHTYTTYQDRDENAFKVAQFFEQNPHLLGSTALEQNIRGYLDSQGLTTPTAYSDEALNRGYNMAKNELDLRQINDALSRYATLRQQR